MQGILFPLGIHETQIILNSFLIIATHNLLLLFLF